MNSRIICLESVDSTNVYLKNLCVSDYPEEGTVILADFQTKGKGQGTNTWHSSPGLNIIMSILFNPSIHVSGHFSLSEFISLGIVDMLNDYGISSLIKWPNDIYVGTRKIAGILVENSLKGKIISRTIAGIGLNVNETDFPSNIPNPVSMKQLLQKSLDKNDVTECLISKIQFRYTQIVKPGSDLLHDEYNQLLYRKGQLTEFQSDSVTFQGTIINVENSGELIVSKQNGIESRYLHGEIMFKT